MISYFNIIILKSFMKPQNTKLIWILIYLLEAISVLDVKQAVYI